ncbi:MFS transporter [Nocardia uniformis]|uniref:MFS transporter n=1 Tax=Nocardia uniformis TaxID=53432 RepID=A0A849BXB1_9NOCA|nr:MFS transporter [Nocardia uniformis]NNH69676.1 MFS transporter [Nocardia uniformis]
MSHVEEVADTPPSQHLSPRASDRRGWLGVVTLAGGTFTVVTSEMLPVGLLTPMSDALRISTGAAGLSLTVTGLVAAVSAPLLTAWCGRFDRRLMLGVLMALVVLGNLGTAWSPNFGTLTAARVLVGIGMGGVWAIAAGLAVRLVPSRSVGPATSLVFSGVAVASVLGIPAGTYIGALIGWRAAFVVTAVLALGVLVAMVVLLPNLPAERSTSLRAALGRARDPRVRTGLIVVAFLVTGHFAAYTYIRPVLEDRAAADASQIGTLLLVYGITGVAGTFAAGSLAVRSPRRTLVAIATVLAATVLLLPVLGSALPVAGLLMAVWGLSYGGVSVTSQIWLATSAPDARESVSALFVGVFNAAIATGALIGGLITDRLGVESALLLGGLLAVAAATTAAFGQAPSTISSTVAE